MALKSLCLIFIICVQVVPQIPLPDDAMHPPHHNIPISAKDGWLVLVSQFFSCNGSHSWHLIDGHSPIIMHSHYIMCTGCTANYIFFPALAAVYAAGRCHTPHHNVPASNRDSHRMLVSDCKDPSQTITKGWLYKVAGPAGPMWYGWLSHPATPLGKGQGD